MTDETRPEQDPIDPTGDVAEQAALQEREAGPEDTGPLPPLPDSAYGEDAEPLNPPEAWSEDDVPQDEAGLLVENPDQPSPYGEGIPQEDGL